MKLTRNREPSGSLRSNQSGGFLIVAALVVAIVILLVVTFGRATGGTDSATRPSDHVTEHFSNSASILGVVITKDLRIIAVEPGTTAEALGMQPNDVITKIGAVEVVSSAIAKDLFRQTAKPGQPVIITFQRAGKVILPPTVVPQGIRRQAGSATATAVPPTLDYF